MGSGQQVVTSVAAGDSYDSLWSVKEADTEGKQMCVTGEPIKCGTAIRLEHS